jgi:hypothetical protein
MATIKISGAVAKAVSELRTLRDESDAMAKRMAELRETILQAVPAGDTGTHYGQAVVEVTERKGSVTIDRVRLENDMPEVFETYKVVGKPALVVKTV